MSKEVNQVNHKDCGPLFNAAKALMNKSGLVKYESRRFVVPIRSAVWAVHGLDLVCGRCGEPDQGSMCVCWSVVSQEESDVGALPEHRR